MTLTETSSVDADSARELAELDFEALAGRADRALAAVAGLEQTARATAREATTAIEAFHRVGLRAIVKHLKDDPRGRELLLELAGQPEVYALLSMHGLVRADLPTRVERVLEMVRPTLAEHGGDVELVDVREGRVVVRLVGNCHGCSMSAVTLKNTVEEAMKDQLPEITGVDLVEEVATVPAEPPVMQIDLPIVGIAADGSPTLQGAGWAEGPAAAEVPEDRPLAFEADGVSVIVVRSKAGLRCFRNSCAHQGLPLDRSICDTAGGTIRCPWHAFAFDTDTGECLTAPQCQLEPFPLRVTGDRIWVRPR